ncbi:uncharacterized protein EAF01_011809 [Botrytis porri]|uniref:uncharacterized protein n=1 Tax=Botrytis porri TaxID=87229 RepID=UPI0019015299|nr:uncharacterized protein EAF01_011809 [Botrytis porri]KAF7882029.1 hypothetical protein EAF01_011809 [Botrytis porri]
MFCNFLPSKIYSSIGVAESVSSVPDLSLLELKCLSTKHVFIANHSRAFTLARSSHQHHVSPNICRESYTYGCRNTVLTIYQRPQNPLQRRMVKIQADHTAIYIDENQTYPTVARELARRFDFYPTRCQFTRKTEEWGLKKNFRKAKRKLLLQNDNKSDIVEFVIGDRHVSGPRRIQRPKRRYAYESSLSQDLSYRDTNIPPKSVGPNCSLEERLPILNHVGEIASAHVESTISNVSEENDAMDLEQWPLSWDIDVPESPGLTRLLRILEIEASMPPLNIDEVVGKQEIISGNELRNNVEYHGKTSSQLSTLCSRARYDYIPTTMVRPLPVSEKRIPWSPLFELDIFPTPRNTSGACRGIVTRSVSVPLLDTWSSPRIATGL